MKQFSDVLSLGHRQKGCGLETSQYPDPFTHRLRWTLLRSDPLDHVLVICTFVNHTLLSASCGNSYLCSFYYFCRYSIFKYTSIALVSVGIFVCTFMSAKQVVRVCSQMISIHSSPGMPRYLLMIQ